MSAAKPKTTGKRMVAYLKQNRGRSLTPAQLRQIRKTQIRRQAWRKRLGLA